jgi:hypothetical protein
MMSGRADPSCGAIRVDLIETSDVFEYKFVDWLKSVYLREV